MKPRLSKYLRKLYLFNFFLCHPVQTAEYCYYYYTRSMASSRTIWVSQYQQGKTSRDLNEARDNGVLGSIGISWTMYKQSAPRFRWLTTRTPRHSIFHFDALPSSVKALKARQTAE